MGAGTNSIPARSCRGPGLPAQLPQRRAKASVERSGVVTASSSAISSILTLFSKFFSSFLHSTCALSVSCGYLALEGVYLPLRTALPSCPTLRLRPLTWQKRYGAITLYGRVFQPQLRLRRRVRNGSALYNSPRRLPVWADAGSLAVTKAILVSFFSSAY